MLNAKIGSMKITKTKVGKAYGYWKGITASESLGYEISVGFNSEHSKKDSSKSAEIL